jgi:hypothetical protein
MEGAQPGDGYDAVKAEAWKKVVELVQLSFTEEPLPQSFGVCILVLIPKGVPDQYQGIALLEVIYKLVSTIINKRIADKVHFHSSIHGFRQWTKIQFDSTI